MKNTLVFLPFLLIGIFSLTGCDKDGSPTDPEDKKDDFRDFSIGSDIAVSVNVTVKLNGIPEPHSIKHLDGTGNYYWQIWDGYENTWHDLIIGITPGDNGQPIYAKNMSEVTIEGVPDPGYETYRVRCTYPNKDGSISEHYSNAKKVTWSAIH